MKLIRNWRSSCLFQTETAGIFPGYRKFLKRRSRCTTSYEAEEKRGEGTERVRWADAEGRVSLEYTYLYPPGIPLIVPGERISVQTVKQIEAYEGMGFDIEGTEQKGQIEVLAHE